MLRARVVAAKSMRHALSSSFSYSRLRLHSDDSAGYSRQKSSSWLQRSFKFLLLGSAPPPRNDDNRSRAEEISGDYGDCAPQKLRRNSEGEDFCRKRLLLPEDDGARPRSKSEMEPQVQPSSESSTQVELRTDSFQATLLWERIVSHLERSVKPGRHSYTLRSYDNCFPGHKVVDCLMGYMNSVLPKSVKKSQARLLGQKLLLTRVIEDARKKEKTVFRESRLYRFTGIHFWDPPSEVHGTRSCSAAAAEGGVYRCHSIENISHGCPAPSTNREHKRKTAGRKNGYMSDSMLASSSLSRRVVQIRSSRGKRDTVAAKSQLASAHLASTSNGVPSGGSSSAYHSQHQPSPASAPHRPRPWFQSDSSPRAREPQSKYCTPTITEEPAVLRSMSPPRASPMTPRSPATDYRINREPRSLLSRGYPPIYPERPSSPDSSVVSGISSYSRGSSQNSSTVQLRDLGRRSSGLSHLHRIIPRPPVATVAPPPPPPNICTGRTPASAEQRQTEQDPSWVVYGYV